MAGSKDTPAASQNTQQALDLEKVTDYVEEKELDTEKVQKAMSFVMSTEKQENLEEQKQRAQELAAVKINEEDVELIVNELDVPRPSAELTLREHKGDVIAALRAIIAN
eukprot:TRINITY_DN11759_c0_g1_i1.p1 TRINITY_DN11759_c0_g1~~TRINITY_DN11759_c0_g1_i1.p1  ORF type:complete len:119 (+),score=43.10 TRINITY_DN11759_c0_g1_i1:31-357(+)